MQITMTPIGEVKSACFYIHKNKTNLQYVYIYMQKNRHFSKRKTICVMFYSQKSRNFMLCNFLENFEIGIYIYI